MEHYSYTKEERETLIRTDDCQTHFDVESFQPKFCNKIRKLKDVEIVTEDTTDKGTIVHGIYKIPLKCVSFRNPKILSEKTRKELTERMANMRENKKETATMQDDQWTQEQEQKYQEYIAKNKEEMRR